jgi:hypothetical protein
VRFQNTAGRENQFVLMFVIFVLGLGVFLVPVSAASADTTYDPPAGTWNGKKIYVSRACHDRSDGIPGGPCIPNHGCQSYNENSESVAMTNYTIYGIGIGSNLLERGYKARKGDGTADENISHSNQWGANLHVPLHSNAKTENCTTSTNAGHGTWGLYVGGNDEVCANMLVSKVGGLSPGSDDQPVLYPSTYVELTGPNAPSCYLEAEFHTWNSGVTWLEDEIDWTYKVGATMDYYFGF